MQNIFQKSTISDTKLTNSYAETADRLIIHKQQISVITSAARKDSHTPLIPQKAAMTMALMEIATAPRSMEAANAGFACPVAEKYAINIILIPAAR